MKNKISVFVGADEFICVQFNGGVDIWEVRKNKNIFLGELENISIPDADDLEEKVKFSEEVEDWLSINFY